MFVRRVLRGGPAVPVLLLVAATAAAQEPATQQPVPLHARIDRLVEAGQTGPLAPLCTDAEFLRRVSLDLAGIVPTAAEARTFLDDPSPGKRAALVERLLADPRYPLHIAGVFDVMLMERRADKYVPAAEWQAWLKGSFSQNKPYDQLAREILGADSVDPALRPAAKFFLERETEPNLLTRDVGRIFFGVDMQCAQCHDHPLIDDYLQADYYGLFAFVSATNVFLDPKQSNKAFLAERAPGDVDFKSVFTQEAGRTRPRLPGEPEIEEPRFRLGEEYLTAPADGVRSVPKHSRRAKLAELATTGANRAFNVNIVNRLWAHLMGRGLVHPVDLHHPANPPSHPEVLDLLATEFVAMKYDVRALLRELALTQTYQRSIDLPAPTAAPAAERLAAVQAEHGRLAAAVAETDKSLIAIRDEIAAARKAVEPVEAELKNADAAVVAAKKPVDDAATALAATQAQVAAKQTALTAVTEAGAKAAEAVKALPGDAEVAQAAATFQARVQQFTTELAALQKTAADQAAALAAGKAKLDEAYVAAEAVHARLVAARAPLEAAKTKLVAASNQRKSQQTLANARQAQIDALDAQRNQAALLVAASESKSALAKAGGEMAASQQSVEAGAADVAKLTTLVADSQKANETAVAALNAARRQFDLRQAAATSLAAATASGESARQHLPSDAGLAAVVQALKSRHEAFAGQLVELQAAVTQSTSAANAAAMRLAAAQQQLAASAQELEARKTRQTQQTAAVQQAQEKAAADEAALASVTSRLADLQTSNAAVASLKPLSPEQMAWSILQVTGVVGQHRAAADAELEKTVPKASTAGDPAKEAARAVQLEHLLFDRLKGNVPTFVSLYGAAAGQPQDEFFATADQALFAANADPIRAWLTPGGGNLTERLIAQQDAAALADELYLAVFTRRPTAEEAAEVTQYLSARPSERAAAVQELAWALLTSAEFRFNH